MNQENQPFQIQMISAHFCPGKEGTYKWLHSQKPADAQNEQYLLDSCLQKLSFSVALHI